MAHQIHVVGMEAAMEDQDSSSKSTVITYDNPVFTTEQTDHEGLPNGKPIELKTKAENHEQKAEEEKEKEEEDDDENEENAGFEVLPERGNKVGVFIYKIRESFIRWFRKQKRWPGYTIRILVVIGFFIYFGFAMSEKYGKPAFPIRGNVFTGNYGFALFILVLLTVFIICWEKILGNLIERGVKRLSKVAHDKSALTRIFERARRFLWIGHILVFVAIALYIGLTVRRGRNYISLIGIVVLLVLGTLGSRHPHLIRWKTVFYSFVIQFILAAIVIRLEVGFQFFEFLGNQVVSFIDNADTGAKFVFGETYMDHFFVFKVTSIIIFLGSFINVLYYLGAMQYIISKIAWLMQKCLDTTAAESMNAAANIFVGMSEAPLMIMPLVPTMTISELHAVLVGGFATMAGSVLATFIFFGVPANHLIAASVMAAPGALGFAKLLLPETHKSKTTWETVKNVPLPNQYNIIDALLSGAANTLKICGYLIANLIAFISVLKFLDVTIAWFFGMVHHPEVNFQYLLGLLFYPFAVIVGIPLKDCLLSSKLIGIKVSLNEFIAYEELGKIRRLRDALIANNTFPLYLNGTLSLPSGVDMLWDDSSPVILTYALCGFANFGAMGIALATLGVFAPTRKRALVKIAPRALIGGNMVALMTASIAGLLYNPAVVTEAVQNATALVNGTFV